jgi:hypothetical protein
MVNRPPSTFPKGISMESDVCLWNLTLHNLQGLQYRTPLQVPFTERDAPLPEPPFIRLSKFLVNEPTPGCTSESPCREIPPLGSPVNSSFPQSPR